MDSAAGVVSAWGCSTGFGFDTGSPGVAAFDGVVFSGLAFLRAGVMPSFGAGRCTRGLVAVSGCDFALDVACCCCFAFVAPLAGCCAWLFAAFGVFGA